MITPACARIHNYKGEQLYTYSCKFVCLIVFSARTCNFLKYIIGYPDLILLFIIDHIYTNIYICACIQFLKIDRESNPEPTVLCILKYFMSGSMVRIYHIDNFMNYNISVFCRVFRAYETRKITEKFTYMRMHV